MNKPRKVSPGKLPTKTVRAPDGELVRLKVVKADSETLAMDLLAAFSSNVRRVRGERREKANAAPDAAKA